MTGRSSKLCVTATPKRHWHVMSGDKWSERDKKAAAIAYPLAWSRFQYAPIWKRLKPGFIWQIESRKIKGRRKEEWWHRRCEMTFLRGTIFASQPSDLDMYQIPEYSDFRIPWKGRWRRWNLVND